MPLTLVTGPANAAKAGVVFERVRRALAADPILVVPTSADAQHYQRELAGAGVVFGAEVLTFPRLVRELARATGIRKRPLSRLARERVVRAVTRETPLVELEASAASPGFVPALATLFAELQRSLAGPGRFAAAVAAWQESAEPGREPPAYAGELARLYSAFHRRLEAMNVLDPEGLAHAALDALRAEPRRWTRPLFLYGFDDLTPAQIDTVEALTRLTDVPVCVALTAEPGRAALARGAATVATLEPLADERIVLEPRSEHYAPSARGALHHLERGLFEPDPTIRPPNGAIRLLEAGGERAEAELVAAAVLELLRDGMSAEDVAVLVRGAGNRELFGQVLESYGVRVAQDRWVALRETRLGAGVLAFGRAALPGGEAADVVRWLRTPGKLGAPAAGDRLEARVRREELTTAREARRAWEGRLAGAPLTELDALADLARWSPDDAGPRARTGAAGAAAHGGGPAHGGAAAHGPAAARGPAAAHGGAAARGPAAVDASPQVFLAAVAAEAAAIWAAPHHRRADVLSPEGEADARAANELRVAAGELGRLAATDPALGGEPLELLEALGAIEVRVGPGAAEGAPGVLLASPREIRARRFRAVVVCGLQEGELPRRPDPEPFLDDAARAGLARASGLVLGRREADLDRERALFYACASRPEEALLLSFRTADEEGGPVLVSPFVEDVRALFEPELWEGRGRRMLAEVTWPPAQAPTAHELRRSRAALEGGGQATPLGPPATPAVLATLAAREREAARGLETFAGCGMRWLIEHVLRPAPAEPDPEPMRRGTVAHDVLHATLDRLRERTGSARLDAASLPAALDALHAALAEARAPRDAAGRAARRRLAVDLERYLRHEAATGAAWEPDRLEWSFEAPIEGIPTALSGRVDRIDVAADGRAVVRDYKGKTVSAGAKWAQDGKLQAALYALAVREQLGLEVAGALYQPIGAGDLRPRGVVRDDVPGRYVEGDRAGAEVFAERLEEARGVAAQAAADLRAGRIHPCPSRCGLDGCAYPGICRAASGAQALAGAEAPPDAPRSAR